MRHFKKYIRSYWKLGLLSVLCVSLEALCDLLQPKLMSRLVDGGVRGGDMALVVRVGLIMLCVVAAGAMFALTRNISASHASQNFGRDLRNDLFVKIQSLSVDDIDRFEGGSLITRMTNDITQVQNFVNMMMRIFFKAPVICVGALIMVSTLNIRAVFLVVPVVICVFSVIGISMKLSYPRFARMQQAIDRLNTTMREYLTGIRLVKAFRRFDTEEKRFGAANDALAQRGVEAGRVMAVFGPCMQFFAALGIAGIIFFGSRWVSGGLMEIGSVMAFVIYMQQITQSFNMISNLLNQIVRVKASGERIIEVLNADALDMGSRQGSAVYDENSPAVDFRNVTFAYKGSTGQPALSGVTFSVKKGATVGVIGSTGSGKTSLAALLLRFYAPTGGEILIGGVPVGELAESELRTKIAVVPQTATLFTGTVKDNILWGRPDASDAEVRRCAELACAHDFISASKDGYDTLIGQSGVNLSGGQKQRLSIARALIRRPDILVLDDCTSALDAITESRVRQNLREYAHGMTCILITQRIGTVMDCDTVLALDHGKVAGYGSHDELMRDCELYRDIYRSQIGIYEGQVV
ncbi:MAG: ABC transporter ATP-binding protein/permease [Oscillospiraceae bacterium]|nr:ABC transporter ATP-binding protein/permease [Oscillospiraceae bacterium]